MYVTSIHYPNSDFFDPALGDAGTIREASNLTMDWVNSVRSKDPNALVLVGGDFNDAPAQKLSYCIYTKPGLMQNIYDLQNNQDGQCPSAGDHSGGFGSIDNIYVSQKSGLTASDFTHVADQGIFVHASDHTPVYATLSSPNAGGGSSFGVATYNIRVPGQASSGAGSAPVDQRATRAAQLLNGQGVDIIGFQEILTATRQALNKSLKGFDSFPTGTKDGPDTSSLLPIYWRTSRFKMIDKGFFATFRPGCSGVTLCAKAPWVELEDTKTGQQVYVSSVHLLNQPGGRNGGGPQREASANEMVDWANRVSSSGVPVIMLGDYNSDYRPSPDDVDIGRNVNRIPYCIFSKAGYVDSYDAVNHNKGYCPSKTKTFAELPYRIDHVYVSAKFAGDVTSEKRINDKFISDHPTTIATISIPGSGGQGSSPQTAKDGWQWPITKASYSGLSQCFFHPVVRGDVVIKSGHTGIDLRAGVGTPVYAAHDGTVVKTDPAGTSDGGKYIIIKNGDKLYSNYQHNSQILVHQGQQVRAGDKIALSGNTGYTTGPHVHFSITTQPGLDSRNSVAYSVDPIPYLPSDRDTGSCH
jgi:endonuclease/exonuclease/phosphatase family metal-dependent hydrolase